MNCDKTYTLTGITINAHPFSLKGVTGAVQRPLTLKSRTDFYMGIERKNIIYMAKYKRIEDGKMHQYMRPTETN